MHANWTLLPRGQFLKRPNILLGAEIELASSFVKFFLDASAIRPMLLPVFVLTVLVAKPNALAGPALHEVITLLAARRAQLGRGLIFLLGVGITILPVHRLLAERHGAELLSSCRCTVLSR